jgi:hypothetical protein
LSVAILLAFCRRQGHFFYLWLAHIPVLRTGVLHNFKISTCLISRLAHRCHYIKKWIFHPPFRTSRGKMSRVSGFEYFP